MKANRKAETSREQAKPYTPRTGARCSCRPGIWRDNCPTCEGSGWVIDFRAIHAKRKETGGAKLVY